MEWGWLFFAGCLVHVINGFEIISKPQGRCLLHVIQKYFCAVYDFAAKADLSKGHWYPKRKFGVTMHFSEIIKQQYF